MLTWTHIVKPTDLPGFNRVWFDQVTNFNNLVIPFEESRLIHDRLCEIYNSDIKLSKERSSISKMDTNSSPGPDRILSCVIKKAGPELSKATQITFQACWKEGCVPLIWKQENRIYLPKADKADYSLSKAYRRRIAHACTENHSSYMGSEIFKVFREISSELSSKTRADHISSIWGLIGQVCDIWTAYK